MLIIQLRVLMLQGKWCQRVITGITIQLGNLFAMSPRCFRFIDAADLIE